MCNSLHKNSKPIDKVGFGYKIVANDKNCFRGAFNSTIKFYTGEKYTWFKSYPKNQGFCFFLSKKEAERFNRRLLPTCYAFNVVKIQYSGGMGCHTERNSIKGAWKMALCKSFTILSQDHCPKKKLDKKK
jgi:hypothetical protein